MSARSRVAFATGVAGLVGATLVLSGRFDGTDALVLLFVGAARAAVPASLVDAGPVVAGAAARSLAQQISFAPAWVLVVAAGALRAGSAAVSDARGANAVAGLAITHGSPVTVGAAWLAIAAGVVAIASRTTIGVETAASSGARGRVAMPPAVQRLEVGAVLGQAALLVTLFAGPQVSAGVDGVPWIVGIVVLVALAWVTRNKRIPNAAPTAFALGAAALVATLAGGTP